MQTQCWGYWKITGLLYLYWPICLGCYAMGLPISDSVWNCGRSLVLWVPGTLGSIGNGILGEYFPEREYNLLDPKRTRKWPKFQPCLGNSRLCHTTWHTPSLLYFVAINPLRCSADTPCPIGRGGGRDSTTCQSPEQKGKLSEMHKAAIKSSQWDDSGAHSTERTQKSEYCPFVWCSNNINQNIMLWCRSWDTLKMCRPSFGHTNLCWMCTGIFWTIICFWTAQPVLTEECRYWDEGLSCRL